MYATSEDHRMIQVFMDGSSGRTDEVYLNIRSGGYVCTCKTAACVHVAYVENVADGEVFSVELENPLEAAAILTALDDPNLFREFVLITGSVVVL